MKEYISRRIKDLPIDVATKKMLLRDETQQKHTFYLNLIDYILPLFSCVESDKKEQISFSGYLYFRFLLEFDAYIDMSVWKVKSDQLTQLKFALELHESAIRELSAVFPTSSPFWSQFIIYKDEYTKALLAEKQFSKTKQLYTESVYEELAAGKSAVCYAAILALSTLNGDSAHNNLIECCLRHIHIAFQYLDDIADFKIDIDLDQHTYAHQLVQQYLNQHNIETADKDTLHKYLYLSNVAEILINKARYHYKEAICIADQIALPDLSNYLSKQERLATAFHDETQLLMQKARLKANKSNVRKPRLTAAEAFDAASEYLINTRVDDLWSDFMTSAGSGDMWISAYTGFMIAEHQNDEQSLLHTLAKLSMKGSFNETILQDGDSTSFLVGLHWRLNGFVPDELQKTWLCFTKPRYGWTTYNDEGQLRKQLNLSDSTSVVGWLSAHDCVTAVAAYILSEIPSLNHEYDSACRYLSTQLIGGSLASYWWTSDIYTLSFTVLAFTKSDFYSIYSRQLANRIVQQQNCDGFWLNPVDNAPNAFYTAIALKALMAVDSNAHQVAIELGICWLISNQMADGSWQTNRILRIPATSVLDPKAIQHWRQSSFGVNTLIEDHNRIFTTVTVLNVLGCFNAINKEPSCLSYTEQLSMSSTKETGSFTR